MPKIELDIPQETLDQVCEEKVKANTDLRIIVLHRGWVVVGRYSLDSDQVSIYDARIIRRWGTIKGLGELAENGPTEKTILDPAGTVRTHVLGVVLTVDIKNESKWF